MTARCPWLTHLSSYAAASIRLRLAAWADDGDGKIRDPQVSICEDLETVMVTATHKNGADLIACFTLPAPVAHEDEFNHAYWLSLFTGEGQESSDCCCCCCWNGK